MNLLLLRKKDSVIFIPMPKKSRHLIFMLHQGEIFFEKKVFERQAKIKE